ncbi:tyrosine-type recombinase/integrase [Viridibacillus sp. YIM B01967]|uniref:Tyrosine-type recombinase/integrase n=1 Tax=Viridibacillus soli TaxID=2798301 RepID=A0ABS1HD27_9BACL|nr:tyrosine-type recombinase/integrase [Viridibacillus soli]MBK3496992.1 tyrosine-type recombinase/integrase [Viridibacillus soli]
MARRDNQLSDSQIQRFQQNFTSLLPFKDCFEWFIKDCEVRNLRSHTISYYMNEMRGFYKITRELNLSNDMKLFTHEHVKAVINHMQDNKLKTTTINTRLRAVRAFFNFLEREGHIEQSDNPVSNLKLLRDRTKVVETYSDKELAKLFKQPDQRTFTGVRDLTLMMMFLETGVRANEMAHIQIHNIDFDRDRILVTNTKGYKQRFVPIQKEMQGQLKKYLHLRGHIEGQDYLWVTIDDDVLSKHSIQIMVSNYGKQAGIKAH